jgi:hypothetical protein
LWNTEAARFSFTLGEDKEPGGLTSYDCPYIPGLRLEDLSHAVLVRQVKEFSLDVHILMRAAYLSIEQRHIIEPCEGLRDRLVPSAVEQLGDDDPALLLEFARAVNPRAVITPAPGETPTWIVRIDEHAEPAPPHPLAEIVGGHNLATADLAARAVPVMLRLR